jgi:hypothetical protein
MPLYHRVCGSAMVALPSTDVARELVMLAKSAVPAMQAFGDQCPRLTTIG